jgi:hypothetical protein
LKFSLWADRVTTKKSLGTSPFQLVYRAEAVFPTHLALPVAKFFQDYEGEPDHMIRRIHQIVEVQQSREQVRDATYSHQQKIKQAFDRKVRKKEFEIGDLAFKWDAPRQDKGKFTASSTPSGSAPSKYLRFSLTTHTGCRIWRVKRFSTALVNGHFSEKMFYLSLRWLLCL